MISYKEEIKKWGRVWIYNVEKIPLISFYMKVFAENDDMEEEAHFHPKTELYIQIKGSAYLKKNKEVLELREGDIILIPKNEIHKLLLKKGGIANIMRLNYTKPFCLLPEIKRKKEIIEKRLRIRILF